jgi:hypothetical protein
MIVVSGADSQGASIPTRGVPPRCLGLADPAITGLLLDRQRDVVRTPWDGALTEPNGRNPWQAVANRKAAEQLKQAQAVATGCDKLPIGAHGKEGVDGSSPSEGSAKVPETGLSHPGRLAVDRACGGCSVALPAGATVVASVSAGGAAADALSWRWIFFVNIPIGAAGVLLSLRYVPNSRASDGQARAIDIPGAITVTGGVGLLVYAIVKAQEWGWGSTRFALMAAGAALLLLAFVAVELRSRAPLASFGNTTMHRGRPRHLSTVLAALMDHESSTITERRYAHLSDWQRTDGRRCSRRSLVACVLGPLASVVVYVP